MSGKSGDLRGYKGRQGHIPGLVIKPALKTVENVYEEKDYLVELSTDEFTTICPKTGLPDFADVEIQYIPGRHLVEEKSLKLYLNGYRDVGIFQENATNKVFEDLLSTVRPIWLKVCMVWKKRGGIGVRVTRETSPKVTDAE